MGKAVPKAVKMRAESLLEQFPGKFSSDFEKNKGLINAFGLSISKVNRNLIAGFIGRTLADKAAAAAKLNALTAAKLNAVVAAKPTPVQA